MNQSHLDAMFSSYVCITFLTFTMLLPWIKLCYYVFQFSMRINYLALAQRNWCSVKGREPRSQWLYDEPKLIRFMSVKAVSTFTQKDLQGKQGKHINVSILIGRGKCNWTCITAVAMGMNRLKKTITTIQIKGWGWFFWSEHYFTIPFSTFKVTLNLFVHKITKMVNKIVHCEFSYVFDVNAATP